MKTKDTFEDAIPKTSNIYFKLHLAKQEIGKVTKGSDNPFFKSKYADLNTILEATEPILIKYNLLLLQPILDGKLCTQIIDIESGVMVSSELTLPIITDPQKQIAGITYFRRASLQSLLSLQAVDDDGNEVSKIVKTQKPLLKDDKLKAVQDAIAKGTYTAEQINAMYQLSNDQKLTLGI